MSNTETQGARLGRMNQRGSVWLAALLAIVAAAAVLAAIFFYAQPYFWPAVLIALGLLVVCAIRSLYGYIIGGLMVAAAIILIVLAAIGYYVLPSLSIVRCC